MQLVPELQNQKPWGCRLATYILTSTTGYYSDARSSLKTTGHQLILVFVGQMKSMGGLVRLEDSGFE